VAVALRQLIDHVVAAKDASTLDRYLIGFLAASLMLGVFGALRFYLVTWLGERVVADLRSAVYRRVVRMDPLFFETTRSVKSLTPQHTWSKPFGNCVICGHRELMIAGWVMPRAHQRKVMAIMLVLIPVVSRRKAGPCARRAGTRRTQVCNHPFAQPSHQIEAQRAEHAQHERSSQESDEISVQVLASFAATTWSMSWRSATGNASMATVANEQGTECG